MSAGGAPLRVGLIGAGRIGRLHAEVLTQRIEDASLACVYDVTPSAAQELAARCGSVAVASVEELLAADCSAVAICSASDSHVSLIEAAAGAGKAIFCEKPVALQLSELDRALEAVCEAQVPFAVGFNRRHDPAHAAVAAAVAEGRVGEPHLVRISSRDPEPPPLSYVEVSGGIFLDMTIHDFDMARFVTGSEVVDVFARGSVRVDPGFARAGDVDTAVVSLVHESGCLTMIDNSRRAVYGFDQRVEVFGAAGVACSENPLVHSAFTLTADGLTGAALPHFFVERYQASYERQWHSFRDSVQGGGWKGRAESALRDARAPLEIGLAAWHSMRERRPVAVEEIL